MRTQQHVAVSVLAAGCLTLIVGIASAAMIPGSDVTDLLLGKPVVSTALYDGSYVAASATDGTDASVLFMQYPPVAAQLVIHDFNASVDTIRLWNNSVGYLAATTVSIKSSTTNNTAITDTFENTLVTAYTLEGNWLTDAGTGFGYQDFDVSADHVAGTRSLYLNLGWDCDYGWSGFSNITEIQATGTPTPEPGTLMLAVVGLLGLSGCGRRKPE